MLRPGETCTQIVKGRCSKCGALHEKIIGSNKTCRTDGVRYARPDDKLGWCVFACRGCSSTISDTFEAGEEDSSEKENDYQGTIKAEIRGLLNKIVTNPGVSVYGVKFSGETEQYSFDELAQVMTVPNGVFHVDITFYDRSRDGRDEIFRTKAI